MEGLENQKIERFKDGKLSAKEADIKDEQMEGSFLESQKQAQITVREMFDKNMEARGTIKDVMNHGVIHPSERN